MKSFDEKKLAEKARAIRRAVVEMVLAAGSGHLAGSLSIADILAALYFHLLKHNPQKPDWPERDRLILSNGHTCPALYAAMALAGYFPPGELITLRKFGSRLQGHPHRDFLPYLETSSGPLGSGLSQAAGMALADRIDEDRGQTSSFKRGLTSRGNRFIYCLMSDGELDAGNTWEAALFAAKEKLRNLIAIVDRNGIQVSGGTEKVLPLEPLADKWRAFGWRTAEIDGHNFGEIIGAVEETKARNLGSNRSDLKSGERFDLSRPTVIIAKTIPGKGVPIFEGKGEWHSRIPTAEEGRTALASLV